MFRMRKRFKISQIAEIDVHEVESVKEICSALNRCMSIILMATFRAGPLWQVIKPFRIEGNARVWER